MSKPTPHGHRHGAVPTAHVSTPPAKSTWWVARCHGIVKFVFARTGLVALDMATFLFECPRDEITVRAISWSAPSSLDENDSLPF